MDWPGSPRKTSAYIMKEIVQIHLGAEIFALEDDACRTLKAYLDDIRSRLPEGDGETMYDIETRIAELFRERIAGSARVVTLDMVRDAMARMGSPADFGDDRRTQTPGSPHPPRRLYRSRNDRMVAGICGGLAAYSGMDATLVRLLAVLLVPLAGLSVWVYPILWIVIPQEPQQPAGRNFRHE